MDTRFDIPVSSRFSPDSRGQNLALIVLYMPYSLALTVLYVPYLASTVAYVPYF